MDSLIYYHTYPCFFTQSYQDVTIDSDNRYYVNSVDIIRYSLILGVFICSTIYYSTIVCLVSLYRSIVMVLAGILQEIMSVMGIICLSVYDLLYQDDWVVDRGRGGGPYPFQSRDNPF